MSAFGRQLALAAGQAQGQQNAIARMLGVWSAPTHRGDDRRDEEVRRGGAAYFARLQQQDRQDQQDALQEQRFQNDVFMEKLRQQGRDTLQQDRLGAAEKRAADAIAAANTRADDRIKSAEGRTKDTIDAANARATERIAAAEKAASTAAARKPAPKTLTDVMQETFAKKQADLLARVLGQHIGVVESPEEKAAARRVAADATQDRIDARQDKSIAASGARQDKAIGAKSEAARSKEVGGHHRRMTTARSKAIASAEKQFADQTDPIFGTFEQRRDDETPEAFEARKADLKRTLRAAAMQGAPREELLNGGLRAIALMDPDEAQFEWDQLLEGVRAGDVSPEDFAKVNGALLERAQQRARE